MPDAPKATKIDPAVSEPDAWDQCPLSDLCRANGDEHPCLMCWDDAGDIVAGLRLEEIQ